MRQRRETRGISLREMAKQIGVSPAYVSRIERDEVPPPAEDKVKAIAEIIECDADDLLARAGRVATDISDIIKRHPVELAALLRRIDAWTWHVEESDPFTGAMWDRLREKVRRKSG